MTGLTARLKSFTVWKMYEIISGLHKIHIICGHEKPPGAHKKLHLTVTMAAGEEKEVFLEKISPAIS